MQVVLDDTKEAVANFTRALTEAWSWAEDRKARMSTQLEVATQVSCG